MNGNPAGQTLSSATAGQQVTRATAQKALEQFPGRVEQVNNKPYFLGKVTRVVLFGSLLKPHVERLSDVDWQVFGFLKRQSRVIAPPWQTTPWKRRSS